MKEKMSKNVTLEERKQMGQSKIILLDLLASL